MPNPSPPVIREFLLIAAAALVSSIIGGGFGYAIGIIAPEFINVLTHPHRVGMPGPVGAAMGMISGLLLGAAVMGFVLLVAAIRARAGGAGRAGIKEVEYEI